MSAACGEPVRHPELKCKIPAQVFCMSWCADFEFRVAHGGGGKRAVDAKAWQR